jgi:hypothetical protein
MLALISRVRPDVSLDVYQLARRRVDRGAKGLEHVIEGWFCFSKITPPIQPTEVNSTGLT